MGTNYAKKNQQKKLNDKIKVKAKSYLKIKKEGITLLRQHYELLVPCGDRKKVTKRRQLNEANLDRL
jgi:hypothetical protein